MNNQGNNWNDNRSGGGFYPEQEIKRTYTPKERAVPETTRW
jgi:hypothetical protein